VFTDLNSVQAALSTSLEVSSDVVCFPHYRRMASSLLSTLKSKETSGSAFVALHVK
jgi:hypothetical protein